MLDAKEDKVHDSLYEGILDRESFRRQLDRVRNERLNLTKQLEKAVSGIGPDEQKWKMVPRTGIEPVRPFRDPGF